MVKASEEDLAWLYPGASPDDTAARWAASGPAFVVLTLGADGARVWWRRGCQDIAPVPVQVMDPVGADDAFMAGLMSRLLHAGPLGGGPGAEAATDARPFARRPTPTGCPRSSARHWRRPPGWPFSPARARGRTRPPPPNWWRERALVLT
ncbi:carbohydrate kinase family protein [Streptomyces sp. NBC_01261]|uniref:carbohydrate kinase family protein n=1 Tax=Streptomyces sp. NBC_01261 TaxID=2903802 RepID=UPI003FCC5067